MQSHQKRAFKKCSAYVRFPRKVLNAALRINVAFGLGAAMRYCRKILDFDPFGMTASILSRWLVRDCGECLESAHSAEMCVVQYPVLVSTWAFSVTLQPGPW